MKKYFNRIGYKGDLEDISATICKDFNIGKFLNSKIIPVGYEDFNLALETTKGRYLAKIFRSSRSLNDCKRNVNIISSVLENGVKHPTLFHSKQGNLHVTKIHKTELRMCVMEYIDGRDLMSSGEKIDIKDMKFLVRQAALINSVEIKPSFIYDGWAITDFLKEFKVKGQYLEREDHELVSKIADEFKQIDLDDLPHCFVHGDIIRTNVIKDKQKGLWIIDFSVSNYYPRVLELAVLASDILFDKNNKSASEKNMNLALKEYQKLISLTKTELDALPVFIKAAHVMHVLCGTYDKKVNNNLSKENEVFIKLGQAGIRQCTE